MLYRGVHSHPSETASKHSSTSCFLRDSLYRPHKHQLWQIVAPFPLLYHFRGTLQYREPPGAMLRYDGRLHYPLSSPPDCNRFLKWRRALLQGADKVSGH